MRKSLGHTERNWRVRNCQIKHFVKNGLEDDVISFVELEEARQPSSHFDTIQSIQYLTQCT